MSCFNYVGTLELNSTNSKIPWCRDLKTSTGKDGLGLNLVLVAAKNNRVFTEAVGFVQDTIKTYDNDRNEMSIEWNDRFDEAAVKQVAPYRRHVVQIGTNRKEFITDYDFIRYVIDNIDDIKGKICCLTGMINKDVYNGKVRDRFQIQNLFVREDDVKKIFKISSVIYWNKESIDLADWKKEKKININAYTKEYIKEEKKNMYVPQSIVFDCSKVDFDNENNIKKVNFRLGQLGLEYEDGEITNKIKKNTYYQNEAVIVYSNGAQEIEFSEAELTPTQKQAIELGIKTIDDFKPKGGIYGERVSLWKLNDFQLNGAYSDGYIVLEDKPEDFEDNIFKPTAEVDIDLMNQPDSTAKIDDDDMFS